MQQAPLRALLVGHVVLLIAGRVHLRLCCPEQSHHRSDLQSTLSFEHHNSSTITDFGMRILCVEKLLMHLCMTLKHHSFNVAGAVHSSAQWKLGRRSAQA